MVNRVLEKPEIDSDWKKDSELTVVGKKIQSLFQRNKSLFQDLGGRELWIFFVLDYM